MPEAPAGKCPHCNDDLILGKLYCANCGQPVVPADQKTAIDSYIAAKVEQELKLRTKDDASVIREVAFKAENEAISRLKRYWWIIVAFISLAGGLLTILGITSIQDARRTVVAEAKQRVEPVVSDVERRARAAQATLSEVDKQIPSITKSLNETAALADNQRQRIEGQSADVTAKLNNFQIAAARADKLSAGFEARVGENQKRLDDLTKRYDTQLNQISRAVTRNSVIEAFPTLDQKPFIQIGSRAISKAQKKAGEKFVNVVITSDASEKGVVSRPQIEELLLTLTSQGFTPLLGFLSIGGHLSAAMTRAGQGDPFESTVIYFHDDFRADALKLVTITSRYVKLTPPSPLLADPAKWPVPFYKSRLEFIIRDGTLDAQIYISAPQ